MAMKAVAVRLYNTTFGMSAWTTGEAYTALTFSEPLPVSLRTAGSLWWPHAALPPSLEMQQQLAAGILNRYTKTAIRLVAGHSSLTAAEWAQAYVRGKTAATYRAVTAETEEVLKHHLLVEALVDGFEDLDVLFEDEESELFKSFTQGKPLNDWGILTDSSGARARRHRAMFNSGGVTYRGSTWEHRNAALCEVGFFLVLISAGRLGGRAALSAAPTEVDAGPCGGSGGAALVAVAARPLAAAAAARQQKPCVEMCKDKQP